MVDCRKGDPGACVALKMRPIWSGATDGRLMDFTGDAVVKLRNCTEPLDCKVRKPFDQWQNKREGD
jgi:hypothetical protein